MAAYQRAARHAALRGSCGGTERSPSFAVKRVLSSWQQRPRPRPSDDRDEHQQATNDRSSRPDDFSRDGIPINRQQHRGGRPPGHLILILRHALNNVHGKFLLDAISRTFPLARTRANRFSLHGRAHAGSAARLHEVTPPTPAAPSYAGLHPEYADLNRPLATRASCENDLVERNFGFCRPRNGGTGRRGV